jgi:predicted dehydrogenase
MASFFNINPYYNWQDLLNIESLDILIICTLHNTLAEITLAALIRNIHILVEKPAAINSKELLPIIKLQKERNSKIHVGFNHRYHRSLIKAKQLVGSGEIGELMFIRARYGHGGRVGYEKEWRSNKSLSGGGELIDQGPHLIDLSRWFLGDFTDIQGHVDTYFWKMNVDDNGFMILKNSKNNIAFLHVSCTEWKNIFSMEIYGKSGKIDLSGLGGSYGLEKITLYKMTVEMGPPETFSWEYPMLDNSWEVEMKEFYDDIVLDRNPSASIDDAYKTLKIIETIYSIRT